MPSGLDIRIDTVLTDRTETVRVDGTLTFATGTDTLLLVDTLVASPSGTFRMGTPEQPIEQGVTARVMVTDGGPIDRAKDPMAIGRGLVLHGRTEIHGSAKTPFAEVAIAPVKGDIQLLLAESPLGWARGDELVIAGSRPDGTGDEAAVIADIAGAAITLAGPVRLDHPGPRPGLNVHVANLTRNAVVESESDEIERRGHMMFMHTTDVEIANAGFYRLGRTNKAEPLQDRFVDTGAPAVCVDTRLQVNVRGRYSVHFHRAGVVDKPAASVRGSVATDNPGWAFVNHSSHVNFVDNVAYGVDGAAFSTEAGDEIGSFLGNISIRSHGSGDAPVERQGTQDFGHAGDGFWFQGDGVRVEGNIATGATGAGFIFYSESLVEPHSGRVWFPAQNLPFDTGGLDFVPVVQVPILMFRGNEAYGSVIGARTYYHRTGVTLGPDEQLAIMGKALGFPQSRIQYLTLWANADGYLSNYTIDTVFERMTIVGTGDEGVGFDASNVYNRGVHRYVDFDVTGHEVGIILSLAGEVSINGGRFDNGEVNVLVHEPRQADRRVSIAGNIEFAGNGVRVAAVARPESIADSADEWFLLTDRILLDFGSHTGRQLFFPEQRADSVLYPSDPGDIEPENPGPRVARRFIGLTNAELRDRFGGSFGGSFATHDAIATSGLIGLVGSPAPDPGPIATADDQLIDLIDEELDDLAGEEGFDLGTQIFPATTSLEAGCSEDEGQEEDEELIEACQELREDVGAGTADTDLFRECAELFDELEGEDEEELAELIARCDELVDGDRENADISQLCEELFGEPHGQDDERHQDELTELRAELDSLNRAELSELVADCDEAADGEELDDDPEFAAECAIVRKVAAA